jgi:thiosulfate reductase cytochrome b subunit
MTSPEPLAHPLAPEETPSAPVTAIPEREVGFSLRRWSIPDVVVGLSSVVLVVALFLNWFTLHLGAVASASRSGTYVHAYLWAAFALSVELCVYLVARLFLGDQRFRDRILQDVALAMLCAGSVAVTLIAFLGRPKLVAPHTTIIAGWSYGAYMAVAAAGLALVVSVGQLVVRLMSNRA